MDIIDLLDSDDVAELPRGPAADYRQALRSASHDFISKLATVAPEPLGAADVEAARVDAQHLLEAIDETLQHYFAGQLTRARKTFQSALDCCKARIEALVSAPVGGEALKTVFRARASSEHAYSRGELFHIPLNKRHLVSGNRYSVPGLPCLYASQSTFACWMELGRPPLDKLEFAAIRVRADKHVRILNIGWRPAHIARLLNHMDSKDVRAREFGTANLSLWPLIAACSYRRYAPRGAPHVVEYIIPQLLLEWILNDSTDALNARIDGVRYFSTHIYDYGLNLAAMNVAFPSRSFATSGYCSELSDLFEMTEPAPWQIVSQVSTATASQRFRDEEFNVAGSPVKYSQTDFAKVEGYLSENSRAWGPVTATT